MVPQRLFLLHRARKDDGSPPASALVMAVSPAAARAIAVSMAPRGVDPSDWLAVQIATGAVTLLRNPMFLSGEPIGPPS